MSMHAITRALVPPERPYFSRGIEGFRAAVDAAPARLPADYERFCEVYGEGEIGYLDPATGRFAVAFVVRVPGAADPDLALPPLRANPESFAQRPPPSPQLEAIERLLGAFPAPIRDPIDKLLAGFPGMTASAERHEAWRRKLLWLELVTTPRGHRAGWLVDDERDALFVYTDSRGAAGRAPRRFAGLVAEVVRGDPRAHAPLLDACRGLPLAFRPADWVTREPAWAPSFPTTGGRAPEREREADWAPAWRPRVREPEPVAAFTQPDPRDALVRARSRDAWVPRVEVRPAARDGAKLGGDALVTEAQPWPVCGHCRRPMQLLVQLPTAALPEAWGDALDGGTLQVFACLSAVPRCAVDAVDDDGRRLGVAARIIDPDGAAPLAPEADGGPRERVPEVAILGFTRRRDMPDGLETEADNAAPELLEGDDEERRRLREALGDPGVRAAVGPPYGGDKLGGWPRWSQPPRRPRCPRCKAAMRLLWQLESEQLLPVMWGDAGWGHVFQCPTHRRELRVDES